MFNWKIFFKPTNINSTNKNSFRRSLPNYSQIILGAFICFERVLFCRKWRDEFWQIWSYHRWNHQTRNASFKFVVLSLLSRFNGATCSLVVELPVTIVGHLQRMPPQNNECSSGNHKLHPRNHSLFDKDINIINIKYRLKFFLCNVHKPISCKMNIQLLIPQTIILWRHCQFLLLSIYTSKILYMIMLSTAEVMALMQRL